MNRHIKEIVNEFRSRPLDLEEMELSQRTNRRTYLDIDRLDMGRAMEITRMISHDDEQLGQVITPIPYEEIRYDTPDTLNFVMNALGLYTFPTKEVTDFLRAEIDDDPEYEPHTAIEICAGMGWIGRTLGIPTTDSRMQEREDVRKAYLSQGAKPIDYPTDIEQFEALDAIRHYGPEYVIASFCTHLYGTGSLKSGNAFGVDTRWVRSHCRRFYHIGNDNIHSRDPIMKMPHKRLDFEWLVTRGDSSKARIYVWENKLF